MIDMKGLEASYVTVNISTCNILGIKLAHPSLNIIRIDISGKFDRYDDFETS